MPAKNNSKKKRRYFLVDYENVKTEGFQGIDELEKSDTVIIFYSANADKMTFQLHTQIIETKAKISYFGVETIGQNALDFQLSSYIGYIIGKKSGCECFIVSNDRGFENVCNFWRKNGVRIRIIPDISKCGKEANAKKSEIKAVVRELGLEKDNEEFVIGLVSDSLKIDNLTAPRLKNRVNQELCKQFGSERTKTIYAAVKQFIK